jgi:hypothetical protein
MLAARKLASAAVLAVSKSARRLTEYQVQDSWPVGSHLGLRQRLSISSAGRRQVALYMAASLRGYFHTLNRPARRRLELAQLALQGVWLWASVVVQASQSPSVPLGAVELLAELALLQLTGWPVSP